MRAASPGIDDAFRKIRIAAGLDGYAVDTVDVASRSFTTAWKEGGTDGECVRLSVRLAPRGRMYDVLLEVMAARGEGETVQERHASADHPVVVRWRALLGKMLERESREED